MDSTTKTMNMFHCTLNKSRTANSDNLSSSTLFKTSNRFSDLSQSQSLPPLPIQAYIQKQQRILPPGEVTNLRITNNTGINDKIIRYTPTYQSHQKIFEPGVFKPDKTYNYMTECVEKTNPFYKPENDCRNWKLYEQMIKNKHKNKQ